MLITRSNFEQFLTEFEFEIARSPRVGLDTECTGIWWWESHHVPWYKPRVFSVQFSMEHGADYYLDFEHSPDRLGDEHFEILQKKIFCNPSLLWFIHNSKYDQHQLLNHGCDLLGKVHCTKQIQRLVENREESLKLDELGGKYFKHNKIDVKTYIKEHKLFTEVTKLNGEVTEWLHFDKIPLDIFVPYGETDTRLCLNLGIWQLEQLRKTDEMLAAYGAKRIMNVYENEIKVNQTCLRMERHGIKVDIPYCKEALSYEIEQYKRIDLELRRETRSETNWNSADEVQAYYVSTGFTDFQVTKKGNISFDQKALKKIGDSVATKIIEYRYHYKRAHTYFENFIWLADKNDLLHADFQPGGPETGRMSCWAPNLQNIPKRADKEEVNYKVRRCFIPRSPKHFFVELDYKAAEYNMLFDYANETKMVEKVKAGMDVHEATKQELNFEDRDRAKRVNFGLIYGYGDQAFADELGVKKFEAKKIKEFYFAKLPKVKQFIEAVKHTAKFRGFVINWLGRVLKFEMGGYPHGTSYKAPNSVCQSGVGEVTKVSMVKIDAYLRDFLSKLVIQIHDANLIEAHMDEIDHVPECSKLMVESYPARVLPMAVDAAYGRSNWGELSKS